MHQFHISSPDYLRLAMAPSSFVLSDDDCENLQCFLLAAAFKVSFAVTTESLNVPQYPVLVSASSLLFGSSSICRGIALQHAKSPAAFNDASVQDALDLEEYCIRPVCKSLSASKSKL